MNYSHEVESMCIVAKGVKHEPAPIPQERIQNRLLILTVLLTVWAGAHLSRAHVS